MSHSPPSLMLKIDRQKLEFLSCMCHGSKYLIFITGLVKSIPAVSTLVCPDLFGSCLSRFANISGPVHSERWSHSWNRVVLPNMTCQTHYLHKRLWCQLLVNIQLGFFLNFWLLLDRAYLVRYKVIRLETLRFLVILAGCLLIFN